MNEPPPAHPRPGDDPEASDRQEETPGNFKRTPAAAEVDRDPLDSGRHLTSNTVLLSALAVGLIGAVLLALFVL